MGAVPRPLRQLARSRRSGFVEFGKPLERSEAAVEVRGFEPLTSSVRGKRSAGLSYTPRGDGDLTADSSQPTADSLRSQMSDVRCQARAKSEARNARTLWHLISDI